MKQLLTSLFFLFSILYANGQSIDDNFSKKEMIEDLKIFKEIRESMNSGLYKYRSKAQIDSIYQWANNEIEKSKTYLDFFNIISKITDFEGSLHNETYFPSKLSSSVFKETNGYFPYSIKIIENTIVFNNKDKDIPVGAVIISINGVKSSEIIEKLGVYWTSDGFIKAAKTDGINNEFSKFFRLCFGRFDDFLIAYKSNPKTSEIKEIKIKSGSLLNYFKSYNERHSKPIDSIYYNVGYELRSSTKGAYSYKVINQKTGYLYINHFLIGKDQNDDLHKQYALFLENTFQKINEEKIENLLVDVRTNTGGTGPNDILTYSYLAQKRIKNAKSAWIRSKKIKYSKHLDIPFLVKPFAIGKMKKELKKEFTLQKENGYYYEKFEDVIPQKNAFDGQVYLLVAAPTASAGSLFAAMVAGNTDAIIVGEETNGGYYGHNGIFPISYNLPNSKIGFTFSVVNIEQNVPEKVSQPFGRGIIPQYVITQSYEDFLQNKDTQFEFTLNLINKSK
jgi:hypothetical protein